MLSPSDREIFVRALKSRTTDRTAAKRCEILLALHDGLSAPQVARRLTGVSLRSVQAIRTMYLREGRDRIFRTRLGNVSLPPAKVEEILELGKQGPPPLSGREIARQVKVSHPTVLRILRGNGLSRVARTRKRRAARKRGRQKSPKLEIGPTDQKTLSRLLRSQKLSAKDLRALRILRILATERIDVRSLAKREMTSLTRISAVRKSFLAGGLDQVLGRSVK